MNEVTQKIAFSFKLEVASHISGMKWKDTKRNAGPGSAIRSAGLKLPKAIELFS
mgnify:FL=1